MAKKKDFGLPTQLFVRRDEDGDDHYFVAVEDGCCAAVEGDGPTCVGIYTLTKTYPEVRKVAVLGEEA